LRCKVDLVDKAGVVALAPAAVFLSRPTFQGFTRPWAVWVAGLAGAVSLIMMGGGLPWWGLIAVQVALWLLIFAAFVLAKELKIKKLRTRVQAVFDRAAAAAPARPIAEAGGVCHVRGRARALKPVQGPLGNPVVAFLVRRKKDTIVLVRDRYGTTHQVVTEVTVEESSGCGVFLIEDETGAALVDDDAFTIAPLATRRIDWDEPISITVEDGAEVEVIGRAERKPASALPELARSGGYREAPSLLVFDGRPEERVVILAARDARAPAG
jgi:hypothetical protein